MENAEEEGVQGVGERRLSTDAEVMEMENIELPNPYRAEEEQENENVEQQNQPEVIWANTLFE